MKLTTLETFVVTTLAIDIVSDMVVVVVPLLIWFETSITTISGFWELWFCGMCGICRL
jgi:hypothetical protein